ncbi:MAG: polysaccharide pyruvyl transferase family protein [Muribaculum sp.]|nr:polysaccharide pyruvyl transferase family protein [Muribaculum sp.]
MRIFTLTCHDVYNYGASLQAFALQRFLSSKNHEVKIIDYKPTYLNTKYRLNWHVDRKSPYYEKCKRSMIFHLLYVLRRYIIQHKTISRKISFDLFTKKYLDLTDTYESYLELCHNAPDGDVYIVGSDQVWNNNPLLNGWDASFFLQFGKDNVKRISYAASLGSTQECTDLMARWIRTFDAVSIREWTSLQLLDKTNVKITVVCDPVFLLSRRQWIDFLDLKEKRTGYILVYSLSANNKNMMSQARAMAKLMKLEIHYLSVDKKERNVRNINGTGPIDFLQEILNAVCVFSDSFHATAFSVIFKRPFYTYMFKNEKASQRMKCLLEDLNLTERYMPADVLKQSTIDWNCVGDNLKRYADKSMNWLINSIQ